MKNYRIFSLMLFVLGIVGPLPCGTQSSRFFPSIESPEGWPIPKHSEAISSSDVPYGSDHQVVHVVRYRCTEGFGLPWYYQKSDGTLVLLSLPFKTKEIDALEINGLRFEYTAVVTGNGISAVTTVRWMDLTGNGEFTKLLWGQQEPDIPKWAFNAKSR